MHLMFPTRSTASCGPAGMLAGAAPRVATSRLRGIIPKPGRLLSLKEIDAIIEAGATVRFRRKKCSGWIRISFCVI
jgi:hypothetical protein